MDDERLVRALKARDEGALDALMQRFQPLLFYIVRPIVQDEREAEECVSDIYLTVWNKIDTVDLTRGSLSAWLTVLARNTALNRVRNKRPQEVPLEEQSLTEPEDVEHTVLRREQTERLMTAVKILLKPSEQILFFRKYYYCQSTAQIAAELGLSPRAVEGRLYRLRRKLQAYLEGGERNEWPRI